MSAHVEMDIFDGIADYVFRLPVEYQTVFMTDAMAKCEEIEDHARFQEWAVENYDVII